MSHWPAINPTGDILTGFEEDAFPPLQGEKDLEELLTIVPGGTVGGHNGFTQINEFLGFLGERGVLRLPVIQVTGIEGPVLINTGAVRY